jgi:hypothetical protein
MAPSARSNMAIGYSVSGPNEPDFPSIRHAGRLDSDPANNLGQGEAIMTNSGGIQTSAIDPADNVSFGTRANITQQRV